MAKPRGTQPPREPPRPEPPRPSGYSSKHPPHGVSPIPFGRVVVAPGAGVPTMIPNEPTPLPEPPTSGDTGELDQEKVLSYLWDRAHREAREKKATIAAELDQVDRFEKRIGRAQKWGGWVWGALAVLGAVFSAGVAWQVFLGATATDDEVEEAVDEAMIEHNGGLDPNAIKSDGERIGHHPDLHYQIDAVETNVGAVKKAVEDVEHMQRKLDKRSEYQFELGVWQARVMEAERKRKPAPPKPDSLSKLERDLMLGDYD